MIHYNGYLLGELDSNGVQRLGTLIATDISQRVARLYLVFNVSNSLN